jgi:hypothetical protein
MRCAARPAPGPSPGWRGKGEGARARLRSAALCCLLLAACGYRSALPPQGVEVAAVTARVPAPDVAACLTTELRLALASPGAAGRPDRRLEAELVAARTSPGALANEADDGATALDQEVELVLVARLVERGRGTVWGPASYGISLRVLEAASAAASRAAATETLDRACAEVARRVVEDLTLDARGSARAP